MSTLCRRLGFLFLLQTLFVGQLMLPLPAVAQYGVQRVSARPSRVVATNDLLTDAVGYRFVYSEGGRLPMATIVETRRYRLFHPQPYHEQLPLRRIKEILDEGFDRAESLLGPMLRRTDVYIAKDLQPRRYLCEAGVITNGLAFQYAGRQVFMLRLDAANVALVAHEALHIRLRELGAKPESWFEEGMAEFAEAGDGYRALHFERLQRLGPLSIEEMRDLKRCSKKGLHARSTAWVMVYYLVKLEELNFAELQVIEEYPEPQEAFNKVVELSPQRVEL